MKHIDTSESGWVHAYAGAIRDRQPFTFADGASLGFEPSLHSLMEAIGIMQLPLRERITVIMYAATAATGMGIVAHGVRLAPGPTKVPAIGIGAIVAMLSAGEIKETLTGRRPARVKATFKNGAPSVEYGWREKG